MQIVGFLFVLLIISPFVFGLSGVIVCAGLLIAAAVLQANENTRIKGTVNSRFDLPNMASPGDIWITRYDGHSHFWDGSVWKDMGI